MKFSAETKDGAIDNLLRAYVSRPSNPLNCADFDPDQANAYVERALTEGARSQYEQHLSGCPVCRKSVVALMRLADTAAPSAEPRVREAVTGTWLDGARRMLGAFARPQWALAAAAVIVAAISLPLILSRDQAAHPASEVQVASELAGGEAAQAKAPTSSKPVDSPALVATARQPNPSMEKTEALAKNSPAPSATPEPVGFAAGADLAKKLETKSPSEPLNEAQRKSDSSVAAAPPQAGPVPGSQARSDFDQNRQQQSPKDAVAQQIPESKAGARAEDVSAKEKAERSRSEEVAQPPAPRASAEESRGRSNLRRRGSLALRDSEADAVRPEERKFSGKKFLFKDGAWTDKDFDPNKDLPIVTIIRDSNVYQEVLKQRPGLKPFLTGFHTSERAIIVYKGTVYKLIPQ